jgi:hypothetical protein
VLKFHFRKLSFKISVFGWPDPNTGFDQSEHALYTCYFVNAIPKDRKIDLEIFKSHRIWPFMIAMVAIQER